MIGSHALVVFGLLSAIFAEQCDIGDFAIDDFSNHVVVTNASKSEDARIIVAFDHGNARLNLKAGATKTIKTIGSLEYTITVLPDTHRGPSYEDTLRDTRDLLQDLSLDVSAPPAALIEVFSQLLLVQSAIEQLDGYRDAQSCGHAIGEGVDSRATMTWTGASNGSGLWVLDCG